MIGRSPKRGLVWLCLGLCLLGGRLWGQAGAEGDSLIFEVSGEGRSLIEVLGELQRRYDLNASYQVADLADIRISQTYRAATLTALIDLLLTGSDLSAEWLPDRQVILKKIIATSPPPTMSLCIWVVDAETGEDLPFAVAVIPGTRQGWQADEYGRIRWEWDANIPLPDKLQIRFLGYQRQVVLTDSFSHNPCQKVLMQLEEEAPRFDVLITDYLSDGIDQGQEQMSIRIRPRRLAALPGQADPDLIRTVQFLPGVSSPTGELSRLYIRGGTPDQNLVLWEGIPVYHTAHFFGMLTSFHPQSVAQMDVYRGGFGARYGERIASVVDMQAVGPHIQQSRFGGGVNGLLGHAYGQLSLDRGHGSLSFAFRRSLTDWWASPAYRSFRHRAQQGIILRNLDLDNLPSGIAVSDEASFADGQLKIAWQLGLRDEVSVAGFANDNRYQDLIEDDNLGNQQLDSLRAGNSGISAKWQRYWSPGRESALLLVHTQYQQHYDYAFSPLRQNTGYVQASKQNELQEQKLQLSHRERLARGFSLECGYQASMQQLGLAVTETRDGQSLTDNQTDLSTRLQVGYLVLAAPTGKRWGGELGLRLSHLGHDQPGQAFFWQPRWQGWFQTGKHHQVHAHLGRYRQFLSHLLEFRGAETGFEVPLWVLAGPRELPILRATHLQLGWLLDQQGWLVDVQGYVKQINGLSSLGSDFLISPGADFFIGEGNILGSDLLIRKRWPHLRLWGSYAWSRVLYQFDDFIDPRFPASHDQRHQLQIVAHYLKGAWEISGGWTLRSGLPYTQIDSFRVQGGPAQMGPSTLFAETYHGERLPWQHQADLTLQWHFPQEKKTWQGTIGISALNIYDRSNWYSRRYYVDRRPMRQPTLLQIDRQDLGFTPNLVLRVDW